MMKARKATINNEFDALAKEQQVPSIKELPTVMPVFRQFTAFINIFR